jgi:hypothetical protein
MPNHSFGRATLRCWVCHSSQTLGIITCSPSLRSAVQLRVSPHVRRRTFRVCIMMLTVRTVLNVLAAGCHCIAGRSNLSLQ